MEQFFKDDQPLNLQAGKMVKKDAWVDDTSLVNEKQNQQKVVVKPVNPFEYLFG